jgi:aryl-alcohol dehydrogenase-like predicted oxidoreductase
MVAMRTLGGTGIEVSPVGLGCWQFSQGAGPTGGMWAALDQDEVTRVVEAALDGGVTWFDTAEAYGFGQSERALSTALRDLSVSAGDVTVATKWLPALRTARHLVRTIGDRLENLQGYPIDLHQVHIPYSFSTVASQMRAMAGLVREGKIRAVGVSNFSARAMRKAARALEGEGLPLASNQVQISLLDRRVETNGVLELARERGITLIAYSPLAQGLLTGRFHRDPGRVDDLPPYRRAWWSPASRAFRPKNLERTRPLVETLGTVAEDRGATVAQVALAWLIRFYGDTVVVIPGASRPEQAADNAAAMELELTVDELARIDRASRPLARM